MVEWIDWGNAPQWLSAAGTVGALWIALILLRNEMRDRRVQHARQVAAWLERDGDKVVAKAKNAGETSIENAVAFVGGAYRVGPYKEEIGVIPPKETREWVAPASWKDLTQGVMEKQLRNPPVSAYVVLAFTDSAGNHWFRDRDGRMHTDVHSKLEGFDHQVATRFAPPPPPRRWRERIAAAWRELRRPY
jgi:hypothetical protein